MQQHHLTLAFLVVSTSLGMGSCGGDVAAETASHSAEEPHVEGPCEGGANLRKSTEIEDRCSSDASATPGPTTPAAALAAAKLPRGHSPEEAGSEVMAHLPWAQRQLSRQILDWVRQLCGAQTPARQIYETIVGSGVDSNAFFNPEPVDLPPQIAALPPAEVTLYIVAIQAKRPEALALWREASRAVMLCPVASPRMPNTLWWTDFIMRGHRPDDYVEAMQHFNLAPLSHVDAEVEEQLAHLGPVDAKTLGRAWQLLTETYKNLDGAALKDVLSALRTVAPQEREHMAYCLQQLFPPFGEACRLDNRALLLEGRGLSFGAGPMVALIQSMGDVAEKERWTRHLVNMGVSMRTSSLHAQEMLEAIRLLSPDQLKIVVKAMEALINADSPARRDSAFTVEIMRMLCLMAGDETSLRWATNRALDLAADDVEADRNMGEYLSRAVHESPWSATTAGRIWKRVRRMLAGQIGERNVYAGGIDAHDGALRAPAAAFIRRLRAQHPGTMYTDEKIRELTHFIDSYPLSEQAVDGARVFSQAQLRQARAAIHGPVGMRSYAPILRETTVYRLRDGQPPLLTRELLARLWHATCIYPANVIEADAPRARDLAFVANQRQLMRESLIASLLACYGGSENSAAAALVCWDGKTGHLLNGMQGFFAGCTMDQVGGGGAVVPLGGQYIDTLLPGRRHSVAAEGYNQHLQARAANQARMRGSYLQPLQTVDPEPVSWQVEALRGACQSAYDVWWLEPAQENRRVFKEDYMDPYLDLLEEDIVIDDAHVDAF